MAYGIHRMTTVFHLWTIVDIVSTDKAHIMPLWTIVEK